MKPKPSELAIKMARIVDAVEKGIANSTIRVSGSTVHVFSALLPSDKKAKESFVKNLFLYTRLKGITKKGQALYVKNIETDERIAFFKEEKVILS